MRGPRWSSVVLRRHLFHRRSASGQSCALPTRTGFTKAQAATGSARRAMKTIRLNIGCALSKTLQLRCHSLRRLLGCHDGMDVEIHEVFPVAHPFVEEP